MRMSDTEAIMWVLEKDPALRSDFCNVTILDHLPHEKRVRATLDRALHAIPRLRQRVVTPPLRLAPPEFTTDPDLDVDYHLRHIAVPAPGDRRALLDVCEQIAEAPFDRSRPLWEFTLVDGLVGGQAALVQKVHHTISDGVGGLRLSRALLDLEPDPPVPPDEPPPVDTDPAPHGPLDVFRQAARDAAARNADLAGQAARTATHVLAHPSELPSRAADVTRFVASVHRQAFVATPAKSDVMRGRSLRRHFDVHSVPLPAIRRVATALGGTVNDAFVTGIACGLGRYHSRLESRVEELRMAMPVSTRARGDDAANRFAPTRVLVPIQPADDPAAIFAIVHERLAVAKREPALSALDTLAHFAYLLPTSLLVAFMRNQTRTIDFAASNMRGSPVPLYLAGARIVANFPFGPRTGSALNITTLGYCDELHLGCNIDPAAITDVDAFTADLGDGFASLLALADGFERRTFAF